MNCLLQFLNDMLFLGHALVYFSLGYLREQKERTKSRNDKGTNEFRLSVLMGYRYYPFARIILAPIIAISTAPVRNTPYQMNAWRFHSGFYQTN